MPNEESIDQTVKNFDVASVATKFATYVANIEGCSSATIPEFNVHDRERMLSYCAEIKRYIEFLACPPDPLDLEQSMVRYRANDCIAVDVINNLENLTLRDIGLRFCRAYEETLQSNSKDRATGFIAKDAERLLKLIENIISFVQDGVVTVDLPINPSEIPED